MIRFNVYNMQISSLLYPLAFPVCGYYSTLQLIDRLNSYIDIRDGMASKADVDMRIVIKTSRMIGSYLQRWPEASEAVMQQLQNNEPVLMIDNFANLGLCRMMDVPKLCFH